MENLSTVTKEMANGKLGVATVPSPESVWGDFTSVELGGLYTGGLYICVVGLDIRKFEQTSLFCSDSYFNLGELGGLFRRG